MLDARRVSVTINLRYISDGECQVMVIIHNRRPGCDCYWCWRWRWLVVWLVRGAAPGNSGGPRPESWHDHGQVSLIRVRGEHCRGESEWLQYTRVPQTRPAWQTRYIVMMSPETWQQTWVTFNTSYWSAFLSGRMVTVSQFVDCWQLTFRNQVIILQIDITRVSFCISALQVLQVMTIPERPSLASPTILTTLILTRSCYLISPSWPRAPAQPGAPAAFIMTRAISVSPTKHSSGASQWITTKRNIHSLVREKSHAAMTLNLIFFRFSFSQ